MFDSPLSKTVKILDQRSCRTITAERAIMGTGRYDALLRTQDSREDKEVQEER